MSNLKRSGVVFANIYNIQNIPLINVHWFFLTFSYFFGSLQYIAFTGQSPPFCVV